MDKAKFDKEIKKLIHDYAFLSNIEEIEKLLPKKDKKIDYNELFKKVKKFIKEEVNKEYLKNRNTFFKRTFDYKLKDIEEDAYSAIEDISTLFDLIDDPKIDYSFYKEIITRNKDLKTLLDVLFYEEDREGTILNELKTKYPTLSIMFDVYRENFFKFDPNRNLLTFEQTKELVEKMRQGDNSARDEIILKNLGLAKKIASKKCDKNNPLLNFEDLYHDGIEGLYKAIEKYNPSKGARFSTYSVYWIKQSINRSIANNGRTVRLPVNKIEWLNKIKREIDNIEKNEGNGKEEDLLEKLEISQEEYAEYQRLSKRADSVDRELTKDSDSDSQTLGEVLSSDTDVEKDAISLADVSNCVKLLKEVLSERQFEIVMKKFGFVGEEMSFAELSQEMHVSKQMVQQITYKAIGRLFMIYEVLNKYDLITESNAEEVKKEIERAKRKSLTIR